MPTYKTYSLWVDEEELIKVHAIAHHRNLKTRVCTSQLLADAIDKNELRMALRSYKVFATNAQNEHKLRGNKRMERNWQRELLKIDKILRDLS